MRQKTVGLQEDETDEKERNNCNGNPMKNFSSPNIISQNPKFKKHWSVDFSHILAKHLFGILWNTVHKISFSHGHVEALCMLVYVCTCTHVCARAYTHTHSISLPLCILRKEWMLNMSS